MNQITRDEILRRANAVRRASRFYSMSTVGPTGYRDDCSGWVSYAWNLPLAGTWGGETTVSLVTKGLMREIPWSQLQPGDAIGHCGAGTGGADGHIILVVGMTKGGVSTLEFCGDTWCPAASSYSPSSGYKAYRYNGIVDGVPAAAPKQEDDDDMKFFIQLKGAAPLFFTDGITSVHIRNPKHLADLKTLINEGLIKISSGNVRVVTNIDLIPPIVGPVPSGFEARKAIQ